MKKILSVLFFGYSFLPLMAQELTKNVAYFELAGAGEFYSLNIERTLAGTTNLINGKFGTTLKTGAVYFTPGAAFLKPITENNDRFLDIGAGASYVLSTVPTNSNKVYGYVNLGYRKHSTDYNPFFWRANFTGLLFRNTTPGAGFLGYFLPWFGVSAGYGF